MAWTTEVTNKAIANGLLKVDVRYTDGKNIFTERYETRSGQDDNWLKDCIKRRMGDLESVYTFANKVSIGAVSVDTSTGETPVIVTEGKDGYKAKLDEFEKYVSAIKKGVIADTNADFVACQKWLQDNFTKGYIDLF